MNEDQTTIKKSRPSQGNVSVGHPVNVATGTLYHEFEDCELSGRIPLIFPRRYSTALLEKEAGMFGVGWHCSFDLKLMRDLDGYVLTDPSGESEITFNITNERLREGETACNHGAFYELQLIKDELCVTHWNVETGDIQRDYFLFSQGDDWTPILRREDVEGNTLSFSYNNKEQLQEITQVREQRSLKLEYNEAGLLAKVFRTSAALKNEEQENTAFLQYTYNEEGLLTKFTDPLGESSHYKYNDNHQMINERTLAGMIYTFRFDEEGRCNYLSGDNDFDLHELNYNKLNQVTEVTNSQGHTSAYHWNEYNQVEKVISPSGLSSTTVYDDDDRIVAEITHGGSTTEYAYDENGNRSSITSPDGAIIKYGYNSQHQVTTIIDPLGNEWKREYDRNGRLSKLSNPLKAIQTFVYKNNGDLTKHKDSAGNSREFQWDGYGNLKNASDWMGNQSSYQWDAFGNLTHYSDAAKHTTTMLRDRLGHLLELTLPDGNKRSYEWDVYDNLKSYVDENKVTTRWSYCNCGNIEEEFKPDGNKIAYGWDAVPGQLAHLTNEKGELYHFDYDEDARLVKETDFTGAVTQYEYNDDGQINTVIKPSGYIARYKHDDAGRIVMVVHDDGNIINYEYDIRGLLVKAENKDCPVSFEYDELGRLVRETQGEHSIEHEYDELNNRVLRKSSLGGTTEFSWNPNGQIASVQTDGFDSVNFEYDVRGYESKRMLGSEMVFEQQVDQRGRLVKQTLNTKISSNDQIQRNYQYDAASNLLSKQDSLWGTTKYTYDILERIESTLHPDKMLERFIFDGNSNIVNHQELEIKPNTSTQQDKNTKGDWQYKQGNQLIERDGVRYDYDADGQLISKEDKNGKAQYNWNRLGQLISIQKPDGSEWFYRYDVLSRRVEKRGPNTHIEYVWDGDVILYEINHTDNESEAYTHCWEYHPHDFSPLYKLENREKQYFSINDQIGTPLELVDQVGGIAWSGRLETFGSIKIKEKNKVDCPIRFQGQWEDVETGFYYNRFRYYDSVCGRYVCGDPIGLLGGLNLYSYTYNPIEWVDPWGLSGSKIIRTMSEGEMNATVNNKGLVRGLNNSRGAKWVSKGVDPFNTAKASSFKVIFNMDNTADAFLQTDTLAYDNMEGGEKSNMDRVLTKSNEKGAYGIGVDKIDGFNSRINSMDIYKKDKNGKWKKVKSVKCTK